jgi:hypothetical protein
VDVKKPTAITVGCLTAWLFAVGFHTGMMLFNDLAV